MKQLDMINPDAIAHKRTTLSRERRHEEFAALEERNLENRAKRSTAHKHRVTAPDVEVYCRDALMVRGVGTIKRAKEGQIQKVADTGCRPQGRSDALDGYEIKIGGNFGRYDAGWTRDDLLPSAHTVLFCIPEAASAELTKNEGIAKWTAVLSRDEFIDLLDSLPKRGGGIHTVLHLTQNGSRGRADEPVLAFQHKYLVKLKEVLIEGLESGRFMSFEAYLSQR